ncbi:hypothetical protein GW17_00025882 [Ensete ventricosum]|nr:hypothetical protein GW17_00025882 [Ensete ventricosum]
MPIVSRLQMELKVYFALRDEEKFLSLSRERIVGFFATDRRPLELQSLSPLLFVASAVAVVAVSLLKQLGDKHPTYDFLSTLSTKCSYSIFSAEHVRYIMEDVISGNDDQTKYAQVSKVDLLIVSTFFIYFMGCKFMHCSDVC